MSKHTPGPWRAELINWQGPNGKEYITWEVTQEKHAGEWYDLAETLTAADARLMAAAPDMLAALQSAVSDAGWLMSDGTRKQCEAALAKANAGLARLSGEAPGCRNDERGED